MTKTLLATLPAHLGPEIEQAVTEVRTTCAAYDDACHVVSELVDRVREAEALRHAAEERFDLARGRLIRLVLAVEE